MKEIKEMLERLEQPLLNYVFSYTNDVESARDLVQDAFLKLQKHIHKLDEDHRTPWLYRVCRNQALDLKRKQARMIEVNACVLANQCCSEPLASARLEKKEQIAILMQLVDTLPDNQKEVVRLSYQSQLSYKEICEITGLSTAHVGYLLSTALKTLRRKMQFRQKEECIVPMSNAQ